MAPGGYQFRPMATDDEPMIRRRLTAPHVVHWWGDGAYEKAGFREDRVVSTLEGPALLMVRNA